MEIKHAKQKDLPEIKHMWEYCFDDTKDFIEWYFKEKYDYRNVIGVYENDKVVSNLQLIPYKMEYLGEQIQTNYIIGVASLPEVRGKGYISKLMKYSLEVMKEKNIDISLLLPFNYEFYRKYGWETCYNHKKYVIPLEGLKNLASAYGCFRKADPNKDIDTLNKIYSEFVKNKSGYIVRTEFDWKCLINDFNLEDMVVYILEDNSVAQGYIVYGLNNNTFNVFEMAYTNGEAFKGILHFVLSHYAQAEKLIWNAPEDNNLLAYLDKDSSIFINPFVMARVVDAKKILNKICCINYNNDKINIKINDRYAQWNNHIYSIKGKEVEEVEEVDNSCNIDMELPINLFTQLATGYITIRQAADIGLLRNFTSKGLDYFEKIFKKRNNFINEYY